MALDGFNSVSTADNSDVITLTLSSGSLGGTTSKTVASGVASFTNLTVATPGTYTLTATSTIGVTSSAQFTITP
jgi:acyl CoA:acetate/3-ketoacid CoA transferase